MNLTRLARLVSFAQKINFGDLDLRCRHVAFILNKNKIISIGINSRKSHTIHKKYGFVRGQGLHAECNSIMKAGQTDHSRNYMISIRIDRNNKINLAKPCLSCQKVLRDVNLTKIYYSNGRGEFEEMNLT